MPEPYVRQYVESSVNALIVVSALLEASTPFRVEPYPNDWWLVELKQTALDRLARHGCRAVSLYDTPQLPDEDDDADDPTRVPGGCDGVAALGCDG